MTQRAVTQVFRPDRRIDLSGKDQDLKRRLLNAYKEGKAYTYYTSGWLHEVFYYSYEGKVYPRAKCRPSEKLNDIPHTDPTGTIKKAYCSCTAGLSQTCNHVAALLFKVEAAVRTNMADPAACTSTACQWNAAPKKAVQPSRVKDMNFKNEKFCKTAIFHHLQHNQGHSFKLESTDVLDRETRWWERGVKEAIYERIYNPTLKREGGLRVDLSGTWDLALPAPRTDNT
ncbi:hypothetical protein Bbelb_352300 [Branchiostoma belcheri]|nr:hypothetical protein Bbelb_352300 [Branchiostoma belcheri]